MTPHPETPELRLARRCCLARLELSETRNDSGYERVSLALMPRVAISLLVNTVWVDSRTRPAMAREGGHLTDTPDMTANVKGKSRWTARFSTALTASSSSRIRSAAK
jgi:hypothetical protein